MAKKKKSDPLVGKMAGDQAGTPDRVTTRAKAPPPPPTPADEKTAKLWDGRLQREQKRFEAWHTQFACKHLDAYYEGTQWRGVNEEAAKKKYVINLVFATVETQLPSLLFSKPKVSVEARPDHMETDTSRASARATLIEHAVQTFIDDPKLQFAFETTLALRDAYPRFAVVEVGYTGDWIDNPNAGKPALKENGLPMFEDEAETTPVLVPAKILKPGTKESLFVKRIPPETFRASPGKNRLTSNDWCGYYEYVQLEDLKKNPAYRHTEALQAGNSLKTGSDDEAEQVDADGVSRHIGMVKLWKIWDLRQKVRHVHVEGHPQLLQENKPFTTLPLAVLKFYERKNEFYPLPPIYNWLGPQDEINEIREMQKVHRRRAVRRYMHDPSVKPSEIEKLETGEDMTAIEVPKTVPPPIIPIQDAPLDAQNWNELSASRDDLNQISGVSGEARNAPDAPTATQANITNVRAQIRESRARNQVAEWLSDIARLILLNLRESMKLPFMVKRSVDPFAIAADLPQLGEKAQLWQEIESEDLDDLDVDVKIDVASLSPVSEDAQRNQWNVVLTLLTNPALSMLLMTPNPNAPQDPSPLLRKTLSLNGITSDQEIREIWRVGQFILQQAAEAAASNAALAKQPEPIKVTLALKGEDILMGNPIIMALLAREGLLPAQAAATAVPAPAVGGPPRGGADNGAMGLPVPPGVPTGTPAKGPAGIQ